MAQQTAVEWLLSELQIRLLKIKSEPNGIERERMINSFLIDAEQAEAIEKEQIENAHGKKINGGFRNNGDFFWEEITGEQYYNDTYENNK